MTTSALCDFAARLRGFMHRSLADDAPDGRSDGEFNALALELHGLQFRHNAAYRLLCEAGGSRPEALTHWSQIPAVPASAFKELELTSVPPAEQRAVFWSSGTSGRDVSRHFHSAESLALYETSLWLWFQAQVMPDDRLAGGPKPKPRPTRLVVLTPPRVPHSSLVHMFETVVRECSRDGAEASFCGIENDDGSWSLDYAQVEEALERAIKQQQPVLMLGTAYNYVHWLDQYWSQGRRFALPPGSRVLETGGYKGRSRALAKEDLHQQLCACLGLTREAIVCEYGMSELSSQAYDTFGDPALSPSPSTSSGQAPSTGSGQAPSTSSGQAPADARRPFYFAPWARVRVVSPETGREVGQGETGLIRVWDLANVWSVLAVQPEDLGVRCGDGFGLLGRAALAEPRGCSLMATGVQNVGSRGEV